jgi:hypothetical protein
VKTKDRPASLKNEISGEAAPTDIGRRLNAVGKLNPGHGHSMGDFSDEQTLTPENLEFDREGTADGSLSLP